MATASAENRIHTQSIARMAEACRYSPGGVHSSIRKMPMDTVFQRAEGAYMWDVDGNHYVDYNAAFAAILLGHGHVRINQAVAAAVQQLDLTGAGTTELEISVARKIVEHVPSVDMVLFCNTGSEATYDAVRLARAATGRMDLLKFQGCYHGWHDYLLLNVFSAREKIGQKDPISAGTLPEAVDHTTVVEFDDLEGVERACRTGKIAAVIIEPIAHNMGSIAITREFAQGLRRICDETGTILIFDEVISGFRHGLGGYQEVLGVMPDLTTMGKAMSNGFPCAAIGGKRDLMMRFATAGGPVYFAGTHNAHTVGLAAAAATIAELEDGRVYKYLFEVGDYLRRGLTEIASRLGIPMYVAGYGSIFVPYFRDPELGPPRNYTEAIDSDTEKDAAFRRAMIERGFFMFPRPIRRMVFTAAHTQEDIDRTLEAAEDALRGLRQK
jgi:glutamate-1-semialdehyde 2,1-aminomutase